MLQQVLENATQTGPTRKQGLYGGDLAMAIKILSVLVNHNNESEITSCKDQRSFVQIFSSCVEPVNNQQWIQYEDQREKVRNKTL